VLAWLKVADGELGADWNAQPQALMGRGSHNRHLELGRDPMTTPEG
jgi:hypothetical protein